MLTDDYNPLDDLQRHLFVAFRQDWIQKVRGALPSDGSESSPVSPALPTASRPAFTKAPASTYAPDSSNTLRWRRKRLGVVGRLIQLLEPSRRPPAARTAPVLSLTTVRSGAYGRGSEGFGCRSSGSSR